MVRETDWKIESRQRPLQENPIGELAGHNYLVLVSPTGQVVEELHGWKTGALLKAIRVKKKISNVRLQPVDSAAVKGAGIRTEEKRSFAVKGDAATSKVVRAGTFGEVRKFWEDALIKAGELDKKNIIYKVFEENSKTFWATMLRAMKIDPEKEDVFPRSNRLAPGSMKDLNKWRPDTFGPFNLEDRSELRPDGPGGRTRFAEEDGLTVPTDLARMAVSAARRRRRRRRHGQPT